MANSETPLILSLETATRGGSIALTKGRHLLASCAGDPQVSHSSDLLRLISSLLAEAKLSLREIEAFAASVGPGSFTGLRIGLATVKSFAATLARPCVGVPTLEAIAYSAGPSKSTLALLPAGRGELFAQLFSVDPSGEVKALDAPTHLTPQKLLDQAARQPAALTWAGEGAQLYSGKIMERALAEGIEYIENPHETGRAAIEGSRAWLLVPASEVLAESVAAQALRRFRAGQSCSPEALQAIYVRPSDAELKEI